jgi:hypothetical protein
MKQHDGSIGGACSTGAPTQVEAVGLTELSLRRELFWQNVMREILNSLAAAAHSSGRLSPTPSGAAMSVGPVEQMFDGRMAVVTRLGQRIPIADVFPVFACSVRTSQADRMLAADVQCTVFQIRTPGGEVYTLPIHEIVAFHSLSEELLRQMEAAAATVAGEDEGGVEGLPFGFGAFTSLAKSERMNRNGTDDEANGSDPDA